MIQTSSQKGFTLIEVLISVLVLGIGLLGLAALQTAGIRSNQNAYLRSQATILAYDIIDRMRANYDGALAVAYNAAASEAAHQALDSNSVITCADITNCGDQELARKDLFEWNMMLRQTLPQGRGTVCIDPTPDDGVPGSGASGFACQDPPAAASVTSDDAYAVKIWWNEGESGTSAVPIQFVVSAQPVIP